MNLSFDLNSNNIFFLRITAIYFNRSAVHILLVAGVLVLSLLVGSGNGGLLNLCQVTTGYFLFSKKLLGGESYPIIEYIFYPNSFIINMTTIPVIISSVPIPLTELKIFDHLHLTEVLKTAVDTLKGTAGIYAIINKVTGAMYIGSSMNIGLRLVYHLVYSSSSNIHLQRAIALLGLEQFKVVLVEEYLPDPSLSDKENAANLLTREQYWLDWLFSLDKSLRYNFLPTAGSPFGYKHSEEVKAKMSGENNHMWGQTPVNAFASGEDNPRFGLVGPNAQDVSVYNTENVFIEDFRSMTDAARWLNTSRQTVAKYIKSGRVFKGKYIIRATPHQ